MTELHDNDAENETHKAVLQKGSAGKALSTILLLLLISTAISAQEWTVPDDKKTVVSPFKYSSETAKKGAALFQKNCISCHGQPTKANFAGLTPSPGDPATPKFQSQVDGALFYKITAGKGLMPSFKNVLTEEERWQVISYFRSFNPKYVQPSPVLVPAGAFSDVDVSLKLQYIPSKRLIKVTTMGSKNHIQAPLSGIEITLWANRYFGDLMIDGSKSSNASGDAYFDYHDSVPGDSAGNVKFIVKLNADGLSGFKRDTSLRIGKPVHAKSLIDTRAMWTVNSQAPIWLIAAYSIVVISVWGILFYIVVLIFRIKKAANKKQP